MMKPEKMPEDKITKEYVDSPNVSPGAVPKDTARQVFRGIAWIGTMRWASQIVSWISTFMVMRLLGPKDYGLFGIAWTFIFFAQGFAEAGIGSTVMTMPGIKEEDEVQLHGASIIFGVCTFIISLGLVYPISIFYRAPQAVSLIVALGVVLILNSAAQVPLARATKALDYKGIAIADMLRSVISAIVSVSLAFSGAGVWSLIGGQITAAAAATTFLLFHIRTAIKFPRFAQLRIPLKYSGEILTARLAWSIYTSLPVIIGGRILGPTGLGIYIFAWTLSSMPGEKLVSIIINVITPLLAREQRDLERLRVLLCNSIEGIAWVVWPILVGLALTASQGISVFFGEQWKSASEGIKILATYQMISTVMTPFSQIFLVSGQARRNRQIMIVCLICLPAIFFVGALFWGHNGLAAAWWASVPLLLVPSLVFLKQVIGFSVGNFIAALSAPAFFTTVMAVGVFLFLQVLKVSESIHLLGAISFGFIIYVMTAGFTRRHKLRKLYSDFRYGNDESNAS